MPRIPETSESTGLRRLAIGGVAVTSAYQQITQNLDKALGPGAGLFLAEPTERGSKIDWYTAADGSARRLADIEEPERAKGGQRLRQTLERMSALAKRLKGEKDEYQSHLGHLIELAIQIPDERHVWLVGEQPVLTFWGTTREVGQPVESPVYRLVPPAPPEPAGGEATDTAQGAAGGDGSPPVAAQTGDAVPAAGEAVQASEGGAATGETPAQVAAVEGERVSRAALILLWILLALILFAIGFQLLRSCAIYVPWLSDMPLVNFCTRPGGEQELARLFNEREKLESEHRLLLEQIERERRACVVAQTPEPPAPAPAPEPAPAPDPGPTPPAPGPTPPAPGPTPPAPGPTPPNPGPTPPATPSKFSGCWSTRDAPIGISSLDPNANSETVQVNFFVCKDEGAETGRFAIRSLEPGKLRCDAAVSGTETADQLSLHYSTIDCGSAPGMNAADVNCKLVSDAELACSQIEYTNNGQAEGPDNQIKDLPFYRVEAIPQ